MKRTTLVVWFVWIAIAAAALWAITRAGTMQTCSTTNELVMLNPYTINTNTFVVSEGSVGDTTATVWTFVNGDATGPDATHLAPTLYPAAGRWVKNAGGSGGTNIFNTIIVTNLTVISNLTADTLWTNKAGVLQPTDLTLPIMLTNQLSFSKGMTNVQYASGQDMVITNGATDPKIILLNGAGNGASIQAQGSAAIFTTAGSSSVVGLRAGTSQASLFNHSLYSTTDAQEDLGQIGNRWGNIHSSKTNYIWGYAGGVGNTEYSRIAISQASTNDPVVFDIQTWGSGTNGANQGFSFRTNGVEVGWFGGSSNSFVRLAGDTMTGGLNTTDLVVGTSATRIASYGFVGSSGSTIGWTASNTGGAYDLVLLRDAPNTLALRNGVNAQTFNIYNTYTDGSNYERLKISATATDVDILASSAGTGTLRPLRFGANNTASWQVATNGHLFSVIDNQFDIGANGANRPRVIYAGTGFKNAVDGYVDAGRQIIVRDGGTVIVGRIYGGSADGCIWLGDTAGTSFDRLQFGGTTSSFPAEKRSAAGFSDVLADDSGPTFRLSTRFIEPKATNYTVVSASVSKLFTNEGATGMVTNTLPAAVSGYTYTFVVQDADGMTVQAVGDDTIRIAGSATGAAGNVSCTVIGNTLTLVAINATEWMAISHEGTWTVSAP